MRALLGILSGVIVMDLAAQQPVDVMPEDAGPIELLTPGTWPLHITVRNLDIDHAIDSLQAHWQLDGGTVHSCTVDHFLTYELLYPTFHDRFTHADPVTLPAVGTYSLKIWTSMPGGFPDTDPSNDTLTTDITVVASLPPKEVMMFYGTHVDCFPCGTYGEPSVEAVLDSFPGTVHLATVCDGSPDPYEVPEGEQFNELYIWPYTGHPAFVTDVFEFPFFSDITTHFTGELYRNPQWRMAYLSPVQVAVEDLAFDSVTRVLSGEVRAEFWAAHDGPLTMNAIITEDSVYGPQWGAPGGFTFHRHILRDLSDGLFGATGVIPSLVSAGEQFVHSFSVNLAPEVVPSNVYVAGIVQREDPDPLQREILNTGESRLFPGMSIVPELSTNVAHIFPNPASDLLTIQVARACRCAIRDGQGCTAFAGDLVLGYNEIDVHQLAAGLYAVQLQLAGSGVHHEVRRDALIRILCCSRWIGTCRRTATNRHRFKTSDGGPT
jgi:hypothetical protein